MRVEHMFAKGALKLLEDAKLDMQKAAEQLAMASRGAFDGDTKISGFEATTSSSSQRKVSSAACWLTIRGGEHVRFLRGPRIV